MKIKIIIIASVFVVFNCLSLAAQPSNIHLSWSGKTQVDTEHTMAITWNCKAANALTLRYGLDSMQLDNRKVALRIKVSGSDGESFNFKAKLKRLLPASRYYYQCGSEKDGWSKVYSFVTAPKIGTQDCYRIGVWGDTQNNAGNLAFEQTQSIVDCLSKHDLNLSIHMGDIVENGSVADSWFNFLHTAQPVIAKAPFMPAMGNHDVDNENSHANFQKPFQIFYDSFNLPKDYLNYSYDYGNIHFVAINSGFAQGAAKLGKVNFEAGSMDYQWLEGDLETARRNKKINWIILYTHYPVYSFGASHIPQWQSNIVPILDKYKVDLCLSGHRHVYERHKAITAGVVEELPDKHIYHKPRGTVYITNGSAGGSLQGLGGGDMPSVVFTPTKKMYTYAVLTVKENKIDYQVFNSKDEQIDFFTIIK